MDGYALLDAGDGERLERFGAVVAARPAPGAEAPRRTPRGWDAADLWFDRDSGWSGPRLAELTDGWPVEIAGLRLWLRPTEAGQLGVFPEHVRELDWLATQVARRSATTGGPTAGPADVLHLFAYTGLVTLALARSGAAVTHLDASRATVAWARRNAADNALEDRPIRWIVDDAASYVARETRRGRRYDGIVLDPPAYGHGRSRRTWRIGTDLASLLVACRAILRDDGFMLLTAHTEGYGPDRLADLVQGAFSGMGRGDLQATDLTVTATSGAMLRLGAAARLDRGTGPSA